MAEHVLTRVHSLRERLDSIRAPIDRKPWQRNIEASSTDVKFEAICKEDHSKLHDGAFYEVLKCTQEAIVQPPWVALAIHLRPGVSEYVRVNFNALIVEELSVPEYLHFKEELVDGAFDNEALLRSDLSMKINKPQTQLFCKTLTASDDTSTHGGFSVPRQATEKISPPLVS